MKKFGSKAGFTLVELIVVIAILGILTAVAIPAYSSYIAKANEAADMQMLSVVNTAFGAACAANAEAPADISASLSTSALTVDSNEEKADDIQASFAEFMTGNTIAFEYYNTFTQGSDGMFTGAKVENTNP